MAAIEIYADADEKQKIGENFSFEPVEAGKITTKNIFIKNLTNFEIDIDLKITGDIQKEFNGKIEPNGRIAINLELNPSKKLTRPLSISGEINAKYIIR